MRRVVITGMGIWSCLGTTLDEVRQSLYDGRSGVIFSQERKDAGFRSALCTAVPQPNLKPYVSRNLRQFMPEEAQYAYMATRAALEDARLDPDYIAAHEVGIVYGNDSVAEATMEALDKFREFHDTAACGSGSIFQSMNSTVTMNLACLFRLRGINLTASAACASGSQSVGLAYLLVRDGLQDCVWCAAVRRRTTCIAWPPSTASSPSPCARTSRRGPAAPSTATADGLVPGGGAATLIVEDYDSAVRRGAPILAEIVGWGFSGNGDHISTPNVEGPARSLELCLEHAGVTPAEIGYVNAHATSTRIGDAREAQAIAPLLRRHAGARHLHQEPDRTRDVDGRRQRTDILHPDDEERIHRGQPQLRAPGRRHRLPEHPARDARGTFRHVPLQLLRIRGNQLDTDCERPERISYHRGWHADDADVTDSHRFFVICKSAVISCICVICVP